MSVQSEMLLPFENEFEREIHHYLGQQLGRKSGNYTVTSPFRAKGREIDGLLITPHCLFTIEAKNLDGTINLGLNTPLSATDRYGRSIDLSERHEDPVNQAIMQWKQLSYFMRDAFETDGIWVKSLLVFPAGTILNVPSAYRNFTDHRADTFIVTLPEIIDVVDRFRPPGTVDFDRAVQQSMVKSLRHGPGTLSSHEKKKVAQSTAPPSYTPSRPQSAPAYQPEPTKSVYQRPSTNRPTSSHQVPAPVSRTSAPPVVSPAPQKKRRFSCLLRTIMILILVPIVAVAVLLWAYRNLPEGGGEGRTLQEYVEEIRSEAEAAGGELRTPTVEKSETESTHSGGETAVPYGQERVQVNRGASNVRSGPGMDFPKMDVAPNEAIYVVLETSEDGAWYKIEVSPGREGWIGSSRVKKVP